MDPRQAGPRFGAFLATAVLVLVVVVTTPVMGSFSLYEDPRSGGVAWLPFGTVETGPRGTAGEDTPGELGDGDEPGPPEGTAGQDAGPEGGPITYVVQPGDTLSDISNRYGVTVTDLWIANRLNSPHVLRAGQSLVIPSSRGDLAYGMAPDPGAAAAESGPPDEPVYHRVKTGENLWVIAVRYGTTIEAICDLNGLRQSALLPAGLKIEIPWSASNTGAADDGFKVFLPVRGEITSGFGMRNGRMHEGVDIAAPRGTPIVAVAPGRVHSAGWMGNYGKAVVIDHGSGYSTLYAHCDKLLVSKGQEVKTGQSIALLGNTGRSTGPHVHFEVICQGKRRNPMEYLY